MFRDDRDHGFRIDRDQFSVISGRVITISLECFPQGEVALDINEGMLFIRLIYREIQRANQENVHA